MPSFRKKPVVIEAFRFSIDVPHRWWKEAVDSGKANVWNAPLGPPFAQEQSATIETLEGQMRALRGDWIIRGIKGELYPCKPDIFEATYEPV